MDGVREIAGVAQMGPLDPVGFHQAPLRPGVVACPFMSQSTENPTAARYAAGATPLAAVWTRCRPTAGPGPARARAGPPATSSGT